MTTPSDMDKKIEDAADTYTQRGPYLHVRVDAGWYRLTNEHRAFREGAKWALENLMPEYEKLKKWHDEMVHVRLK